MYVDEVLRIAAAVGRADLGADRIVDVQDRPDLHLGDRPASEVHAQIDLGRTSVLLGNQQPGIVR